MVTLKELVDKEEIEGTKEKDIFEIRFNDGEKVILKDVVKVKTTSQEKIEFVLKPYGNDTTLISFPFYKIEKIRVQKTDIPKTFFSTMWILFGTALVLVILWPGGFSVGG